MFDFIQPKEGIEVPGLKYVPTSEPERSDDEDHVPWVHSIARGLKFSAKGEKIIKDLIRETNPNAILEIGVHKYPYKKSTFRLFTEGKSKNCVYLGVDILDKSNLNNPKRNIHTIKCSSFERDLVKNKLDELGVEKIDLLMIDGWHSINAVVNDWQYTEILSEDGVVVLHDTNAHTGPVAVFDAIDETLWEKKKYCRSTKKVPKHGEVFDDWGLAIVKRVK